MSSARKNPLRRSRRRRTNQVPVRQVLVRGGLVTGLLLGFIYLATILYNGVPGRSYVSMTSTLPSVGNLISHDAVRLSGVRIGQVHSVDVGADSRAKLELQLEPGTRLPVDSRLVVRANGLLGARFVQIVAGDSTQMLGDGDEIKPDSKLSLSFGVPEALDTLDARTRGGLRDTLDGLGTGLRGHGDDINLFLGRVSDEVVHAQELFQTIVRQGDVPRLLPSLEAGVRPLSANRHDLAAMTPETVKALRPLVTERDAVRSTLDQAPGALDATNAGLARGTRLLASVRGVADSAARTLPFAPAGLRTTSRLLAEADTPLQRTNGLLKEVEPAVPAALKTTQALRPALKPLTELSDDLDPMVTLLGRYGCDIVNFGTVFRSMTGSAGNGSGPNGSLKAFRLQAIAPSLAEVTSTDGAKDPLFVKDAYPTPCKYLSKPYPGAITKVPQG